MSQYVNVGGPFEIMDTPHKIEVWGQPVEIPEALAHSAILDGAHLLPVEQFADHKFTADELKLTNARVQAGAPPEFHEKHKAAIQAAREYRAQIAAKSKEVK